MIGIVFKASEDIGEKFAKFCNPADCHPSVSSPSPLLKKCSLFNDFLIAEDFGKRNMPGKRARRHFSQLSEFERGLIIGMKTAGWSTRRVAGHVDRSECAIKIVGSSGHEKVPTHGKPGLE
ncbi:hypothetical protein TNCV_3920221 [Trichonephila clavipes]|nr:hypothetical protein TNCV_3920221 [Trichonephila clavipes]